MNLLKPSLSKRLDRLMSNMMCNTSLFMLNNMTEMYEGLLSGEQTDVTSAEDLPDVAPTLKESERLMSVKLYMDASMCMPMKVAKMYASLLNGEQTICLLPLYAEGK